MRNLTKLLGLIGLLLALSLTGATAETTASLSAREYAQWLESALPGAAFEDTELEMKGLEELSEVYEIIGRTDATYGSYLCGTRRADVLAADEDWTAETVFNESGFEVTLKDAQGSELYRFPVETMGRIHSADGYHHWIATMPGSSSEITLAADEEGRARIAWRAEKGFDPEKSTRLQLSVEVHNLDSWLAGVTNQPSEFYLNVDDYDDLLTDASMETAEAFERYDVTPIGVSLCLPGDEPEFRWSFVLSSYGQEGVNTAEKLFIAGPGFDRMLDRAEAVLGYRPGDMDFLGKKSVRAVCRWKDGSINHTNGDETHTSTWSAGEVALTDADDLARLDKLLNGADFTVGSVNCPADFFLVVEYEDGSTADIGVAINSFSLFFYHGVCFEISDDDALIDLFNLRETDYYRGNWQ